MATIADLRTAKTGFNDVADLMEGDYFDAGTYTPTLTNSTNVASSTAYVCQYMRVGIAVTVSGFVDIDPTATGNTILFMSLPIASNLASTQNLGGVFASATSGNFGGIYADASDRALFRFNSTTTATGGYHFTFTYRII